MSKTIFLVRHAQGEHNINNSFHIQDAVLTDHGKDQCRVLRESFPCHDTVQIILTSPLRRAIQTAVLGFAPALRRPDVPILLLPQAQEISAKACDVGFEMTELEVEIQKALIDSQVELDMTRIDYSILEPQWNSKAGKYSASLKAVEQRAADLRTWLWQRPETCIVLVTHGAFLHYLTEDWTAFEASRGTAYQNCEFRQFTFTAQSNETDAHLILVGGNGERGVKPPGTHSEDITGVEESSQNARS